jgi:hypothetical protein
MQYLKNCLFILFVFICPVYLLAQIETAKTDSIKPRSLVKPYNAVITSKAKTSIGFFKIHKVDDRYFFEIPNFQLGRDLLVVNRISKASEGIKAKMFGFAGDQINEHVIRFVKGPNNKVFLKSISYTDVAKDSSADGMYHSVMNNNLQPVVAAFDVKAFTMDSIGVVIDMTDYINSDNDIFFFNGASKLNLNLGLLQADKSYISSLAAYPMNIEIKTMKTYIKATQPLLSSGGGFSSYELNSSIVLLPEIPMLPRNYDDRVGYFSTGYTDFDANPQGVERTQMITRWRLKPKKEDIEKYLKGEMVEPENPIIYYIDPATPKKWVPYLMQGVNDWQKAFEKAGFKNAIIGKEAPTGDSTWSIDDARHNVIVYKPSIVPNASGPHVHDPRSGEIIETHINWYHNVMQLLHNWYFIQASAVDPKARTMKFSDELMGQLIRFVSSHEIGHTLGLRHNFGSSSTVPVENLRNKAWVEANGHTPSIMDYARFNYVAQPEDSISEIGLFPRIGDYDKWAIEWGYRWWPEMNKEVEKTKLNEWIITKLKDKRLWFGDEQDPNDPRSQSEDLGDDAMKAGTYGIKNLQRIVPNLTEWTKEANEGYESLAEMYKEVTNQFGRYVGHVVKNIGGILNTPKTVEEKGNVFEYVSKEKQQSAMHFLQEQLFTTPTWLLNKKIFLLTGTADGASVSNLQNSVLKTLIGSNTMDKLLKFEAYDATHVYTAVMMLNELKKGIWSELPAHRAIEMQRRILQKMYVERITAILNPPSVGDTPATGRLSDVLSTASVINKNSDMLSIIKAHAKSLLAEIKTALPLEQDEMTKLHLQDCLERINEALHPKNQG